MNVLRHRRRRAATAVARPVTLVATVPITKVALLAADGVVTLAVATPAVVAVVKSATNAARLDTLHVTAPRAVATVVVDPDTAAVDTAAEVVNKPAIPVADTDIWLVTAPRDRNATTVR